MKFIEPFWHARWFMLGAAVLGVILALAFPAKAEAPACMTPKDAIFEIAKVNAGATPAAVLEGDKAQAFAAQAGRADGKKLVYLIYIHEGHVFIFEFADGCFRTQGGMPLEQFRLMFPGVLPEDK